MGQKVHPLGFRLGYTKNHQSKWFTNPKTYSILVAQDRFLRELLFEKYRDAGISGIEIERKVNQIQITLKTAQPRIILKKEPSLPRKQSRREERPKRATRTIPVTNSGFSN